MEEARGQTDPLIRGAAALLDAAVGLPSGAGVVVGVSGGADSVALLAVLRSLADEPVRAYRLTVAHLNHKLRDGADADEAFVGDLARRWELPCIRASRDVASAAEKLGQGLEQAGRMLRYEFLRDAAAQAAAGYVAVGHHSDDNVETILYRIVRGTHLRGLAGIPVCRPIDGGPALLIRPLLTARREEIKAFCRRQGLNWRTDPTNARTDYRRNFIRHELLPLLREKLNPRADEAILRLAAAADEAERLLAQQAEELLEQCRIADDGKGVVLSIRRLSQAPPPAATYVLRGVLEKLGVPMRTMAAERFEDLRQLLDPAGAQAVTLPGGFLVRRRRGELIFERPGPGQEPAQIVAVERPGRTVLDDGGEILCQVVPLDQAAFDAHRAAHAPGVEMLDADQMRGPLVCRPRRRGDAFAPLGCSGRQSVSDFLTNAKLSRGRRDRVRCLCDEVGIVYLLPLRIDNRVRVTAATRRLLRIEYRPPAENRPGNSKLKTRNPKTSDGT